jgi:hypothetical protein
MGHNVSTYKTEVYSDQHLKESEIPQKPNDMPQFLKNKNKPVSLFIEGNNNNNQS